MHIINPWRTILNKQKQHILRLLFAVAAALPKAGSNIVFSALELALDKTFKSIAMTYDADICKHPI